MRIRSITCFIDSGWPLDAAVLQLAGEFLREAREAFSQAGFEVQTVRLATPPFPQVLGATHLMEAVSFAQVLEGAARAQSIDYLSIGPALPSQIASFALVPEILLATQNVFTCGLMTNPQGWVDLPSVHACAQVIFQAARISPDGFGNLRFTALGNVLPGTPFFPAAYHAGGPPAFAIATEAADLAVEAFISAFTLEQASQAMTSAIERSAEGLTKVAEQLAQKFNVSYGGIDFTLAPFPEQQRSIGYALERAGVPAVGAAGTLAAAAMLGSCIDRASFHRAGFSGMMFPVLEDATLAIRAAEGMLTVSDLLLYSTVCGIGLDCIPLPGDTSPEQIQAVLLDVASLSIRLNKPLTARLLPIPGAHAGEPTRFEFSYFANTRILPLLAEPLKGLLASSKTVPICAHSR